MIFGNVNTFAVMAELDDPSSEWLFGKFSYVLDNHIVGNYSAGCSLLTAAGAMTRLLNLPNASRDDDDLMRLGTKDLFDQLENALYRDRGQSDDQVTSDRSFYWRFQVKDIGLDVFDGWKCYLIEDATRARFIWCDQAKSLEPVEVSLTPGEFNAALSAFVSYVGEILHLKR